MSKRNQYEYTKAALNASIILGIVAEEENPDETIKPGDLTDKQISWLAAWLAGDGAMVQLPGKPEGEGWEPFGTHVNCPGQLEFGPEGEDGLPDWERPVRAGAVHAGNLTWRHMGAKVRLEPGDGTVVITRIVHWANVIEVSWMHEATETEDTSELKPLHPIELIN